MIGYVTPKLLRRSIQLGFEWGRFFQTSKRAGNGLYLLSRHRNVESAWRAATADAKPIIKALQTVLEELQTNEFNPRNSMGCDRDGAGPSA